MNRRIRALCLLCILMPCLALAAESEQRTEASDGVDVPEIDKQDPPEANDTLRDKKLSDAFKDFTPTERISADNAVPFPVDI